MINPETSILEVCEKLYSHNPSIKTSIPEAKYGHISLNAPIVLGRRSSPIDIFNELKPHLEKIKYVEKVDFASGFCNITLSKEYIKDTILEILKNETHFGYTNIGKGQKVNVEYISGNPTGTLHLGHTRGIYGDVLANLLKFVNYDVTKEYYINDAGNQISVLGQSVFYEYSKISGRDVEEPEEIYKSEEVKDIALALHDKNKDMTWENDKDLFIRKSLDTMLNHIKDDLKLMSVQFDIWTSETTLHQNGKVDQAISILEDKGVIVEGTLGEIRSKKGKASNEVIKIFNVDCEKAVTKSDGSYTYFGADIGYQYDKVQRGFKWIINCIGSDQGKHFDYIASAIKILDPNVKVTNIMFQSIDYIKDGQKMKFSKRRGVTFRPSELLEYISNMDILRMMITSTKNDSHFSIDIDKISEVSMENLFYYIQYAYARSCSILRNSKETFLQLSENMVNTEHYTSSMIDLAYNLSQWPREVKIACDSLNVHAIVNYIKRISTKFHSIWNEGKENPSSRWIIIDSQDVTASRINLVKSMQHVIKSAFNILSIKLYERLESD
jgi:arginyl-tRNA synthetase